MKTSLIALSLTLLCGPALAGPCTERIAAMEKTLATSDAGSGPTAATSGDVTGSVPATPREVPKAGEAPGTGGTSSMNAAVGNRATSPGDVRAQTQGAPTAAQAGDNAAAGNAARDLGNALDTARQADARGDAAACGKALDDASRLLKG
ncbi:hypothetical protein [Ancylobacter terrae]|uniref:hypothetical protein n=1 Tax=Ancylobacter sp. sgz301288 TaxID=3342077 RepID=UPI00385FAAA6